MPPPRSRRLVPRRRRTDDGEEENSIVGDVDDDSLSEGSAISGGDEDGEAEASDGSVEDEPQTRAPKEKPPPSSLPLERGVEPEEGAKKFTARADTEAVLNGLMSSGAAGETEELHFDEAVQESSVDGAGEVKATTEVPKAPRNETFAQKSKREHQEYLKERDTNPAFVPNRGGFFLHDDRSNPAPGFANRTTGRGRGRGFNGSVPAGRGAALPEPSEKPWAHDLHDRHENAPPVVEKQPAPTTTFFSGRGPSDTPAIAPNRTFSFSAVLGNVPVNVSMPGTDKKTLPMVKKNHTLLPQHRPPLRRDKPVRISVPNAQPRYIFPSTERSFIFIPRALRPNQQYNNRGRGRGSFHGSRRTSIYGGSTYTPSVAMSRKSSLGGPVRDMRSPAAMLGPQPVNMGMQGIRPVVRMPVGNMMPIPVMPTRNSSGGSQYAGSMNGSMSYGFHSTAIPMHQPRPQKAVSVADIESPASLPFKGPQQQHQQPFHQQVPNHFGAMSDEAGGQGQFLGQGSAPGGTPLSHIPEGAVYANPFQPFPMMQGPMMYSTPYHPVMADGMQYAAPMQGMPFFQPYAPLVQPQPSSGQMGNTQQATATAHESNGMVYYGDATGPPGGQTPQQQFAMPAPNMMGMPMNPQAPYYYPPAPNGMFYPTQSA